MTISREKREMLERMVEGYKARHASKSIILVDEFPSLMDMPRTNIGHFVWSTRKVRMLQRETAVRLGDTWASPADLAKEYLSIKYEGQKRRTDKKSYQKCFCPRHKGIPLMARQSFGNLVYVDLKAAYWNILRTVGWDVDYMPGGAVGVRSENEDFPFDDHKLARNILVSIGLPKSNTIWTGSELRTTRAKNPLYNGILWCFVQDVLNGVASDMLAVGALYVHTDGYIFRERDEKWAREVVGEWGLEAGTKYRGYGEVYGVSNYWIQGKATRRKREHRSELYVNVRPPDNLSSLRTQFLYWREKRALTPKHHL